MLFLGIDYRHFNWMYGLSGNDYRVATLSNSYLTVIHHAKLEIDKTILVTPLLRA